MRGWSAPRPVAEPCPGPSPDPSPAGRLAPGLSSSHRRPEMKVSSPASRCPVIPTFLSEPWIVSCYMTCTGRADLPQGGQIGVYFVDVETYDIKHAKQERRLRGHE